MNRWIILFASILCQTAIGGIYAWSTFTPHLEENYGLSLSQCALIFGLNIAVFSSATLPAGKLLKRFGPRPVAGVGSLLFIAGFIITSLSGGELPLMLLGFSVVTGIGIGFVYVCPLTVGMQWFPNRKGMVTGAAVAGFGMGAVVLANLAEYLMYAKDVDPLSVFRIAGLALGIPAFCAAMLMSLPPKKQQDVSIKKENSRAKGPLILLCWGMFAGTGAGLFFNGNLLPIFETLNLPHEIGTWGILLFAIGNTAGRLLWGVIHDLWGGKKSLLATFTTLLIALLVFTLGGGAFAPVALISTLILSFGFGGCFVLFASATVETYGVDSFPTLYPFVFLSYGVGALVAPLAGGATADITGSYNNAFIICSSIIFFTLILLAFKHRERVALG